MSKIYAVAILIGLLLGPAYGIYCHYLSGEDMETVTLFELTEDRKHSNGNKLKGIPFKSETASFRLTPDMNPIGLSIKAQLYKISPSTLQKQLDFEANLRGDDGIVWQDTHRLTWKQSKKKGKDLSLSDVADKILGPELARRVAIIYSQLPGFEVKQAGDYKLTMTQKGEKDAEIATMHVTVRRNVTVVNTPVFMAGCILLVVGFVALLRSSSKKKKLAAS